MPLSKVHKAPILDSSTREENPLGRKRKFSENYIFASTSKRAREHLENESQTTTTMTDAPKRANFSALNPSNGIARHASPLSNNKSGAIKKLVIKNFKGETMWVMSTA